MNTNVKVNYEDDPRISMEIFHKREEQKGKKRAAIIQKCLGTVIAVLGGVSVVLLDGDMTAFIFCALLGAYLITTRHNWLIN